MEESDIEIQVKELYKYPWLGGPGDSKTMVFSRENVSEHIDCSNSSRSSSHSSICHGGGISRGEVIKAVRDILEGNKKPPIEIKCPGREGSKKGRIMYRGCIHGFVITVKNNCV